MSPPDLPGKTTAQAIWQVKIQYMEHGLYASHRIPQCRSHQVRRMLHLVAEICAGKE